MHFKRDRYVCGYQNKHGKKADSTSQALQTELTQLRKKKQKALDKLLDDKIDQGAYDDLVTGLNPKIEKLVQQLNELNNEETELIVSKDELKTYILSQLNPKQPLTEITPTLLARFIHKIIVKADGQLEVHYRTSKPSAFYVSNNINLDIPMTHPNKAYVKKYA